MAYDTISEGPSQGIGHAWIRLSNSILNPTYCKPAHGNTKADRQIFENRIAFKPNPNPLAPPVPPCIRQAPTPEQLLKIPRNKTDRKLAFRSQLKIPVAERMDSGKYHLISSSFIPSHPSIIKTLDLFTLLTLALPPQV